MNYNHYSFHYYQMVSKYTKLAMKKSYIFFGMEEFYSYQVKTLQKRQSRETKYNNTKTKNIYITMYNYKLNTIARLVLNKSIQAVQLM